ncbi:MAG: phage protein Gp36 family protein [Treponemataceae bacterium]
MKNLISVEEFLLRISAHHPALPSDDNGELDTQRITIALNDATGIICSRLLWLLDDEGLLIEPVNPKFDISLKALCSDIALHRLTDTASQSEQDNARYKDMMKLLEAIDREYKGGLSGVGLQESSVVITPDEGIADNRFFKKGRMY